MQHRKGERRGGRREEGESSRAAEQIRAEQRRAERRTEENSTQQEQQQRAGQRKGGAEGGESSSSSRGGEEREERGGWRAAQIAGDGAEGGDAAMSPLNMSIDSCRLITVFSGSAKAPAICYLGRRGRHGPWCDEATSVFVRSVAASCAKQSQRPGHVESGRHGRFARSRETPQPKAENIVPLFLEMLRAVESSGDQCDQCGGIHPPMNRVTPPGPRAVRFWMRSEECGSLPAGSRKWAVIR